MEYIASENIPYFKECSPLIKGLGYDLVDLLIVRRQNNWQVQVVITNKVGIGIDDCTKVHRTVLPRLEALLDSQNIYIEVTSPGMDRVIKNAREFELFVGEKVKIWDRGVSDWIKGVVLSADREAISLKTDFGDQVLPYSQISKAKLNSI